MKYSIKNFIKKNYWRIDSANEFTITLQGVPNAGANGPKSSQADTKWWAEGHGSDLGDK